MGRSHAPHCPMPPPSSKSGQVIDWAPGAVSRLGCSDYSSPTRGGTRHPGRGGCQNQLRVKTAFAVGCSLAPLILVSAHAGAGLANGVDPNHLGQGDWIWEIPACQNALGVSTPQAVIDYEAGKGMQWICVKAGDGVNEWSQWNAAIINEAHAEGMKIFAWVYIYGNYTNATSGFNSSEAAELNVAKWALSVGGDGLIIDAESEYEGQAAAAAAYASGIKAAYPSRFLAYAPFSYISYHPAFPYVQFGTYCDAVMPQDYWADLGISVPSMVHDMDAEWSAWQNGLTGTATNAIKPIIPIGQGWNSSGYAEPVSDITNFVYRLKNDPLPAGRGGYHGVSYWSCQHHTVADWNGMAASLILAGTTNLTVPQGSNATFALNLPSGGAYRYQWKFNGADIPGATNSSCSLFNVRSAEAGAYSALVTNPSGCALSYSALLSVVSPLTNAPGSVLSPPSLANWWPADGSGGDIFVGGGDAQQNATYYAPGEVRQSLHFDGAASYLKTGLPELSPPWTVCLWVNRQNAPGASAALFSDTSTNVLKLEQYNGTRKVGVTILGVADYTFNYTAPLNTWTHLALVDNGASIQLYADGVLQGAVPVSFPLPRDYIGLDTFSTSDAIGARKGRTFTDYLLGSLDEILLFHRALSASEIAAIHSAGGAGLVCAPEFTGVAPRDRQLELFLRGQTGKSFSLYSSADLANWTLLETVANPTGALTVTNVIDPGPPQSFYRLSQP
ncbi:MAG: LamG domain-containing protein [Verrucomicrobiota bacterium]|nr:LamG domain-containing protein [Verrucomicrobiota bacterium]